MRKESPLGPFSSMPLLKEGTSRVARDTNCMDVAWYAGNLRYRYLDLDSISPKKCILHWSPAAFS